METHNDWYGTIVKKIGVYKDRFSNKESFSKKDYRKYKRYKLDLLLRVAKRVASFSDCGECQSFQGEITKLVDGLGDIINSSKENLKKHSKMVNTIIKHLQKNHKLVREGYYIGVCMGMGTAFGVALNAALGSGAGIAIGICIGFVIGKSMDAKAKKEGRVI